MKPRKTNENPYQRYLKRESLCYTGERKPPLPQQHTDTEKATKNLTSKKQLHPHSYKTTAMGPPWTTETPMENPTREQMHLKKPKKRDPPIDRNPAEAEIA